MLSRKNIFLLLFCYVLLTEELFAITGFIPLNGTWKIATDPDNSGRSKNWNRSIPQEAVPCHVPWILQGTFPDYFGLVWYWREFEIPQSFLQSDRFLLRFEQVDYYGEIWLNGKPVGKHEGGETPFVLDVTDSLLRQGKNFLAVRVLNPTQTPIDDIIFSETPHRCKVFPFINSAGSTFSHGGITGSVRLEAVPNVYISDMYTDARIDGNVTVQVTVNNTSAEQKKGTIELAFSDGRNGDTFRFQTLTIQCLPGLSTIKSKIKIENPRLWQLNSPALYRVTARLSTEDNNTKSDEKTSLDNSTNFSEKSVRFGFRDFRFENGFFRLNGKRIFLKSTHTVNNYPIGLQFPHDPDLWRRDLLNLKAMGFNMVRFIWGGAFPEQLDYCDEIGLMVYDESYASADMKPSAFTNKRWHDSVTELIKRDRNHPSIVIWGLLNEIRSTSLIFKYATEALPLVRGLDSSRLVMLNSGRWDFSSFTLHSGITLRAAETQEPFVGKNTTNYLIETLGITWPSGAVALHPGSNNEYSVARWTAPENGSINISGCFKGLAGKTTTDVHIVLRGKSILDSFINLKGNGNTFEFKKGGLTIAKNETLDFVVGSGNRSYGGDTTGLSVTIDLNGKSWDLTKDFNAKTERATAWTYGKLPWSDKPNVTQWLPYPAKRPSKSNISIGTLSNPDSLVWEDLVKDTHPYQRVPHTSDIIQFLRTTEGYNSGTQEPLYLSEYGIGSAVDLIRTVRFFEQNQASELCDAKYYRSLLARYLSDWNKWNLQEAFDRPEDFFAQSIAKMAGQRTIGLNAIRSNPAIIGHNLTGGIDHVLTGEGLTTPFRELKPGTIDAIFNAWAPLRWSVFAEPIHLYRGSNLKLEVVLSNEDVLAPGKYPARAEIFDEKGKKVYSKHFEVIIDKQGQRELPFAKHCFNDNIPFGFPSGTYRFVTTMEKGGAPAEGEVRFYVTDRKEFPKVQRSVLLWNDDPVFMDWCLKNGIQSKKASSKELKTDSLIVATDGPISSDCPPKDLDAIVRSGTTLLFLCPNIFDKQEINDLFIKDKGTFNRINSWLYQKDEWSKIHPFFSGMPSGGLMNNQYYREIIPDLCFMDSTAPETAVAGAIKASQDYSSGLMLCIYRHGKGHIILSTFLIRETLGKAPAAEFLLKNILNFQK